MRVLLPFLVLFTACKSDPLDTTDDGLGTEVADEDTDTETDADTLGDPNPDDLVTSDSPRDWQWLGVNTAMVGIRTDISWPDAGLGAFLLSTGSGEASLGGDWPAWSGAGGKAFLGINRLNGLNVSDVEAMSFSTYVDDDESLLPYINVFIDVDGDGLFSASTDEIWAFDPAYISSPAIGGNWQQWDAMTDDYWRCVFGRSLVEDGTCAETASLTWSELVRYNPDAVFVATPCGEAPFPDAGDCSDPDLNAPSVLFVGGQKSGGPWAEWMGWVDGIELEPGGPGIPMNFEP
ncbi:MAG: hypothetical protein ACJAZO_003451 [Myxococcota bacterium]|jgi:hypothetical protein